MSKDWQKGSGYVKEPKIVKEPWSTKSGYSQAKEITPPDIHESQTVTVRGTKRIRADKKPVKAAWY